MVRNARKQDDAATAKAAGTRLPPESTEDRDQPRAQLMDEPLRGWHPGRISDRKLNELANRLGAIRSLGGAFARVVFSEEAAARLLAPPGEERRAP